MTETPPAPPAPRLAGVLLASGACRRMRGEDKLLRPVGGIPLVRRTARLLTESGLDPVLVVLPPEPAARRAALVDLPIVPVINPDCAEGIGASIRAAIPALPEEAAGVCLALADMPALGPDHLRPLIAAFAAGKGRAIIRPRCASGRPGHPVIFPRALFGALASLAGDEGARAVIRRHGDLLHEVEMTDDACCLDLDTPEAWAAWERSGGAD